ncbi:DMT family transporter [Halovenus marina]|uniref:DMT family transporter n=1 Tax=Halovenus marina TaxID=3396621 RepID=UPI003F572C49
MLESTHLLAIGLALVASVSNGFQSIFIRKGTDGGKPLDGVIVVMLVNTLVLLPAVVLVYYPDYGLTQASWVSFIGAGLFGTLLGRALMYTSIDKIGASRTIPIIASQTLFATIFGVLLLGETLNEIHAVAIVCIVGGVSLIAWETSHSNPDNLSRKNLLLGLLIPFGAAVAYGSEPIFASVGFGEGTPSPVGLVVKTTAATVSFTLYLRLQGALPSTTVLQSKNTRWFVFAGLANTVFLVGYYVALEMAPVNVIIPVLTTSTLFTVVLSAVLLPERLERVTWKVAAAATTVVLGVLAITIYG